MILDKIENAARYGSLHREFAMAFDYLRHLKAVKTERVELNGRLVYALFSQQQGKTRSDAFLEAHKKYIDIHFCIGGEEEIGWRAVGNCLQRGKEYDAEKDFMTFGDAPESWSRLTPGSFAIYFPDDAHAPMVSERVVTKAVVKVAVD